MTKFFLKAIAVVLGAQPVFAQIPVHVANLGNTKLVVQKIDQVREVGIPFLALANGDMMFSREAQAFVAHQRADKICKKYGYNGVSSESETPFKFEPIDENTKERDLWVVNRQFKTVPYGDYRHDVTPLKNEKEAVVFFAKSLVWMATFAATSPTAQQFSYLECETTEGDQ